MVSFITSQYYPALSWLEDTPDTWRAAMRWVQGVARVGIREMELIWNMVIPPGEAVQWLERALSQLEMLPDDPILRAKVISVASSRYRLLGDQRTSMRLVHACIPYVRAVLDENERSKYWTVLGVGAREAGEYELANEMLQAVVNACPNLESSENYTFQYAHMWHALAENFIGAEDPERAAFCMRKSEAHIAECRFPNDDHRHDARGWFLNHAAHLALLLGDIDGAISSLRASAEELSSIAKALYATQTQLAAWNHQCMAECELSVHRLVPCAGAVNAVLNAAGAADGDKTCLAWTIATYAGALLLGEEPERAAVMWGAAEALRDRLGGRIAPASRKNREHTVNTLTEILGPARFAELCAEGARMSMEQSVAYARAGLQ